MSLVEQALSRAAAVSYVARGYGVFPGADGTKHPRFAKGTHPRWAPDRDGPAGLTLAAWTARDVRDNWPNLSGIVPCLVPPECVAFIDADEKHRPGITAYLLERWPALGRGGQHRTPSGGAHFPGRIPAGVELPQTANRDLGIDIRAPRRGYIVAPPGTGYAAIRPFAHAHDLPEIPASLIDYITPQPRADTAPAATLPPASSARLARYVWAAVQGEHDNVAAAVEGTRNHTLHLAALKLGSLVGAGILTQEDARDALLAAARVCGLPEHEARGTIDSGLRFGIAHPRQIERPPNVPQSR